ncbi:MAG TPA: TetR/AcrR family transcriptional regulator, partial [Actinomycetota bacterium]|nr:TetR/AcrR family transcriptional regulator [Actinomycetota bacterium]
MICSYTTCVGAAVPTNCMTHFYAPYDHDRPRQPPPLPRSRRQEQARRTRRAILDAAGHLFVERGYAATTMTAIAQAAGVALDTVYAAVGPSRCCSGCWWRPRSP